MPAISDQAADVRPVARRGKIICRYAVPGPPPVTMWCGTLHKAPGKACECGAVSLARAAGARSGANKDRPYDLLALNVPIRWRDVAEQRITSGTGRLTGAGRAALAARPTPPPSSTQTPSAEALLW